MAITPPIMVYPLGTDYYDVAIFNENWQHTLSYLDNNFLNNERVLSEQLSTSTTNVLSAESSNKLFENGVGADVLGYIEDGATHTAGTVWLSKFNKGEFKCLVENTDDFIDTNKWFQIDDLTNASKLDSLYNYRKEFIQSTNDPITNGFTFMKFGFIGFIQVNNIFQTRTIDNITVNAPSWFVAKDISIEYCGAAVSQSSTSTAEMKFLNGVLSIFKSITANTGTAHSVSGVICVFLEN